MMKIEFTPEAVRDLQRIKSYLDIEFGELIEKKALKDIMDSIEQLGLFPESGEPVFDKYGIAYDYFIYVVKKNYVFYRIERDSVKIVRVLDWRRDFMKILFENGNNT